MNMNHILTAMNGNRCESSPRPPASKMSNSSLSK